MAQDSCSDLPPYSTANVVIENVPFVGMLLLGAAIMLLFFGLTAAAWAFAAVFIVWGLLGALGIMLLVCPHCPLFGTRACPCGYATIAAKLRSRGDLSAFARMFRIGIVPIVPLWFIPPALAIAALVQSFNWTVAALLAAFVIDAFIVIPVLSRAHGCKNCPQRQACPWMAR